MHCDGCGVDLDSVDKKDLFVRGTLVFCDEACAIHNGMKFDEDKLRYELIPPEALESLAKVLSYGAKKYAPDSWKNLKNFEDRYTGAILRHFQAWRLGEDIDFETGLHHLEHMLCNVAFLVWKIKQKGDKD